MLESNLLVKDKTTVSLGGFIQNTTNLSWTKIPILGDIICSAGLLNRNKKQEIQSSLCHIDKSRKLYSRQDERRLHGYVDEYATSQTGYLRFGNSF